MASPYYVRFANAGNIKKHRKQLSLSAMCRQLAVSRESYHKWLKRASKASVNKLQQHDTDRLVKGLFYKHKRRYGAPRIAKVLRNIGIVINRKTVAKSMKKARFESEGCWKVQSNHRFKTQSTSER